MEIIYVYYVQKILIELILTFDTFFKMHINTGLGQFVVVMLHYSTITIAV